MKRLASRVCLAMCVAAFLANAPLSVCYAYDIIDLNKTGIDRLIDGNTGVPENILRNLISYRETQGPITAPEQILHVPGMTRQYYDALAPFMLNDKIVIEVSPPPGISPY